MEGADWPETVLVELFSKLPVKDLLRCAVICKYWYNTLSLPLVWERLWQRDFEKSTRRRWKNIRKFEKESDTFFRYSDTNCERRDNRKEIDLASFLDNEREVRFYN